MRTINALYLSLLISCGTPGIGPDYSKLSTLPTREQVGAAMLPDTIARVNAPFDMPIFRKPVFPDRTVNLKKLGADTTRMITKMLQKAIDSVSEAGGGTVLVPEGKWKTGRIALKSHVNLHLEQGAELHFSHAVKDYQPAVFTRIESLEVMSLAACIYANNQENIALTGNGKLVGPYDGEIKKRFYIEPIESLMDLSLPANERIHDGSQEKWVFPPKFISPINCRQVYIEGISLVNTAFWNIVPIYCENVIIRGVTINSVGIPRGDGIDIESSRNVLIEYCTLRTGDDCFTMKAGRGHDGLLVNKPTENIVVRHCLAMEGHGGITCGSETAGTIRNLYVHDCVFDGTGVGIRFKTRRPRGGGGENLFYDRIRMNLKNTAIKWDMLGKSIYVGDLAKRLPVLPVNELTPFYRNVKITNIVIEQSTHFLKILGIPESPLNHLLIDNVAATCDNLMILHDAQDISIQNSYISTPDSLIDALGIQHVSIKNVGFDLGSDRVITDSQDDTSDEIAFINCQVNE